MNRCHIHRINSGEYAACLPKSRHAAATTSGCAPTGRSGGLTRLGLAQRDQATLQALTQEVITTSAIEGQALDLDAVRSSIARRLGVDIGALAPADRNVDGVVDMVLDATQQHAQPLTAESLFG